MTYKWVYRLYCRFFPFFLLLDFNNMQSIQPVLLLLLLYYYYYYYLLNLGVEGRFNSHLNEETKIKKRSNIFLCGETTIKEGNLFFVVSTFCFVWLCFIVIVIVIIIIDKIRFI